MADLPARTPDTWDEPLADVPDDEPLCATCDDPESACACDDFDGLPGEWEE